MGLWARLNRGTPLDDALEQAFAHETTELNHRRMRLLSPIMVTLHALHALFFYVTDAKRATLTADVVRWRDALTLTHALMVPFALGLLILSYRARDDGTWKWLAPIPAAPYLHHGSLWAGPA